MPAPLDDRPVRRVFSPQALAALEAGIAEARGLPNEAFTSEAFFQAEQALLFARTWSFAGLASAMPAAGDLRPVEVAGRPIVLVRDRDGGVRAFHNVCPIAAPGSSPRPRTAGRW